MPSRLLGSGVTYRYGATNVLYPFGYGLSYASFEFSALKHAPSIAPCDPLEISNTVSNTAKVAASEVVQVYLQWHGASAPTPATSAWQRSLAHPAVRGQLETHVAPAGPVAGGEAAGLHRQRAQPPAQEQCFQTSSR